MMPKNLSKDTGPYWYERQHAKIDLYVGGALRASLDYFAGSAVIFPHGDTDGLKVVAPWSKDIFGIVEEVIGIGRVTEIRYPPIGRSDWRKLGEGRTKEIDRLLYGPAGEFHYFIDAACTSLSTQIARGLSETRKARRKLRLRAASARALDALLGARRAAERSRGKARAVSLLQQARDCLEGIPAGKVLIFETEALSYLKMALASVRAGKCVREPLSGDEEAALRNILEGLF
jgi:hypothetical protein